LIILGYQSGTVVLDRGQRVTTIGLGGERGARPLRHPGGPAALGSEPGAAGAAAEEADVSRLSVMDHYFQLEAYGLTASEPILEGCTPSVISRPTPRQADSACSSRG
jgi:hypothetical protein